MKPGRNTWLFLCLLLALPGMRAQTGSLDGSWGGYIHSEYYDVNIGVQLMTDSIGACSATFAVPGQNLQATPFDSCRYENNRVALDFSASGIRILLERKTDLKMEGYWLQGSTKDSLSLQRNYDYTELIRPQNPKPPFIYSSEDVKFFNSRDSIWLAGTLTRPNNAQGDTPAVVMISGSGASNRDQSILDHHSFHVIADYLSSNGVTVLRYDDRGVASSEGVHSTATSADLATDAVSAFDFLKTVGGVDSTRIGLIGHSEGGMIAPMVEQERKDVAFLVMMAGPGIKISELMAIQNLRIFKDALRLTDDEALAFYEFKKEVFETVSLEVPVDSIYTRIKQVTEAFYHTFPKAPQLAPNYEIFYFQHVQILSSKWMTYFLGYNPEPALRQIDCPVLAFNGTEDIQVTADENLKNMKAILGDGPKGTNQYVRLVGLNHLFQKCYTCKVSEYGLLNETINPEVLGLISSWIKKNI